jgi:hypothetical protein
MGFRSRVEVKEEVSAHVHIGISQQMDLRDQTNRRDEEMRKWGEDG